MSERIEPQLERFGDSLIFENENGVLVAAVGVHFSPQSTAWWEKAIYFCPFCGTNIQEPLSGREEKDFH